jgi:hypothetical protein
MKFTQIAYFLLLPFFLISCKNALEEKPDLEQKDSEIPSIEQQRLEKSLPDLRRKNLEEKPRKNEVKKSKAKAIDTLKPLVAIP